MITITKEFNFSAAHSLPNHKGLCFNIHGHNYKLFVEIKRTDNFIETGHEKEDLGMVQDFSNLKKIVNEKIIKKFDHSFLNNFVSNPTAENLLLEISNILMNGIKGIQLVSLKLYETETSYATWTPNT